MNDIRYSPAAKHVDHIKPLCIGGLHTRDNVRVICQDCNLRRPRNGSDVVVNFELVEVMSR